MIVFLLQKITSSRYQSMEEFPIADWVQQIAEGEAVYQTAKKRTRKAAKEEFYKSRK